MDQPQPYAEVRENAKALLEDVREVAWEYGFEQGPATNIDSLPESKGGFSEKYSRGSTEIIATGDFGEAKAHVAVWERDESTQVGDPENRRVRYDLNTGSFDMDSLENLLD